jgi:hypothetical protein
LKFRVTTSRKINLTSIAGFHNTGHDVTILQTKQQSRWFYLTPEFSGLGDHGLQLVTQLHPFSQGILQEAKQIEV